jgi:AcrR family transcriptional regulator
MSEFAATTPRSQRTRLALLQAFRVLVLRSRYDDLKISQIIGRARVARSTFYAHFANKDAILLEGLSEPFTPLANLVLEDAQPDELVMALQHFWDNRRIARRLLTGPMRVPTTRLLVEMIERRLALPGRAGRDPRASGHVHLLARQIAGGQIAVISAWVEGEASCTASGIAEMLRAAARAALAARGESVTSR